MRYCDGGQSRVNGGEYSTAYYETTDAQILIISARITMIRPNVYFVRSIDPKRFGKENDIFSGQGRALWRRFVKTLRT